MRRQTDRLKLAPSELGFGKDVGQRPSLAQRDCTPWMQFPPQSYSGTPRRLTLPLGELRAMRRVGFSSRVSSESRLSTRDSSGSFGLQKLYVSCGGAQARGMLDMVACVTEVDGRRIEELAIAATHSARLAANTALCVLASAERDE